MSRMLINKSGKVSMVREYYERLAQYYKLQADRELKRSGGKNTLKYDKLKSMEAKARSMASRKSSIKKEAYIDKVASGIEFADLSKIMPKKLPKTYDHTKRKDILKTYVLKKFAAAAGISQTRNIASSVITPPIRPVQLARPAVISSPRKPIVGNVARTGSAAGVAKVKVPSAQKPPKVNLKDWRPEIDRALEVTK